MFFLKTISSLSFGSCTPLKWVNDSCVESFESIGKFQDIFFEVACQLFMPGIPSVSKYIKGITYDVLAHKEPRSSICNELWKILLLLLSVSNYYPAKIMCVIVESNSAFNCFRNLSLAAEKNVLNFRAHITQPFTFAEHKHIVIARQTDQSSDMPWHLATA